MNLRRIGVLFLKDLRFGSRGFIFVFAVVMPLVLSLIISLLFGSLFSEKPRLGIVDAGGSQVAADLLAADFMQVQAYPTEEALLSALDSGGAEVGLVLPVGFDAGLQSDARTDLTFYVWGQSLINNRAIISAAITEAIVDQTGRETPIAVDTVLVGDRASESWQQRLLPLVVLMSIMLGGMLVPSTSLIEERQKRTLTALTTTPMTLGEVLITKGVMGTLLSIFTGFAILTLNGGWGPNPALLLLVLVLSGIAAATFGVLLGTFVKDLQTLMAVVKSTGILLYAPALIALFPDAIPQWVARLFPTYYILQPVLDVSQRGAGFGDIAFDLLILVILTAAMMIGLGLMANRLQTRTA